MEDPTTPWLVARAVADSGRPRLWSCVAAGFGAAVVVVGGLTVHACAEPGVVQPSVPAVTAVGDTHAGEKPPLRRDGPTGRVRGHVLVESQFAVRIGK